MTIQWPDESQPPQRPARERELTTVGALMPADIGSSLPAGRGRRDVLVLLGFIAVLVILFALLWLNGPLPRVFPQVPGSDGGFVPALGR